MLLMSLQYSFLVGEHYFLTVNAKNGPSGFFEFYTWNLVSPLQSTFAVASDFIVVAMTIDRSVDFITSFLVRVPEFLFTNQFRFMVMRNLDMIQQASRNARGDLTGHSSNNRVWMKRLVINKKSTVGVNYSGLATESIFSLLGFL